MAETKGTMHTELSLAIKREAARLGFAHCRITPAGEAPHADFFDGWVAARRHGEMGWLETTRSLRRWPRQVAGRKRAPAHTIIIVAVRYRHAPLPSHVVDDPSRGVIAAYAWGDDYHDVIRRKLHALDGFVRAQSGRTALATALVDSGPILERDWAQRAGIGFTGKNSCTICPGHGSWLLLATLLVPEPLAADPTPPATNPEPDPRSVLDGLPAGADYGAWTLESDGRARSGTCGRCTRCLTACPTEAFVGPYHLDAGRCISYWTIETQSPIPHELRPRFGNRIFGCDVCQEVCPWNFRLAPIDEAQMLLPVQDDRMAPPLLEGFMPQNPYWLHDAAFHRHFDRSPLLRATRAGMLRNVCVSLGNWGATEAIPALEMALNDAEAAPRGHAAWALGRIGARHGAERVESVLRRRFRTEADAWVRGEIEHALAMA